MAAVLLVAATLLGAIAVGVSLTGSERAPDQLGAAADDGEDPAARCTATVMGALRDSSTIGPERPLDSLARHYGTNSVEYRTYLKGLNDYDYVVTSIHHGMDAATAHVTPHVEADCAASRATGGAGPTASSDPCAAAVMGVFQRIATTGDYTFGPETLIPRYGTQSPEFLAYANLQARFVGQMTTSGARTALRTVQPDVEAICAGRAPSPEPSGGVIRTRTTPTPAPQPVPAPPQASDTGPPGGCQATMTRLLRDVVTGRQSQAAAEARAPDDTGRERLRSAIAGAKRYQADGLSRDDAISQASDAFTYYCPR